MKLSIFLRKEPLWKNRAINNKISGSIVQWIEYQIPVLKIWVRFPLGLHTINPNYLKIK